MDDIINRGSRASLNEERVRGWTGGSTIIQDKNEGLPSGKPSNVPFIVQYESV